MSSNVEPDEVDNDELSAFVTSTLKAIAYGIVDAQQATNQQRETGYAGFAMPKSISFDVAVSAKRTGDAKAGFKVEVFSIGANAAGGRSTESHTTSRISFDVPWGYHQTGPINIKRGHKVSHD